MLSPLDYTVGWICALEAEFVAARSMLDEIHDISLNERSPMDDNVYTLGSVAGHNVVIMAMPGFSCRTTSSASNQAQILCQSFPNIRVRLLVGIAGGVPLTDYTKNMEPDIRLGDVVVGTEGVVHLDYGKRVTQQTFSTLGHCRPPPKSLLVAVNNLRTQFESTGNTIHEAVTAMKSVDHDCQRSYEYPGAELDFLFKPSYIHKNRKESCLDHCNLAKNSIQRNSRSQDRGIVRVHFGAIGSANQVMRDGIARDEIARQHSILCFEMENATLAAHLPCLVIKGISDYADSHKSIAWQSYAAACASSYAKELLRTLRPEEYIQDSRLDNFDQNLERRHQIILSKSDAYHYLAHCNIEALFSNTAAPRTRVSRVDIEHWLAASDPEIDFQSALNQREPGTASWLLHSESYREWRSGATRHLYVHGKPGSGKSIISASVIENIRDYCAGSRKRDSSIFYFSFGDRCKQSHKDCLRSVIQQIFAKKPIPWSLEELFAMDIEREETCLNMDQELQKIFCEAVGSYEQYFLILDGLDECVGNIKQLVHWLGQTSAILPMLQIFATCRPEPDIESSLMELGFHSESIVSDLLNIDIGKYVSNQLDQDTRLRDLGEDMKEHIRDVLVSKAAGIFLWATFQVKALKRVQSTRPAQLERVLSSLPLNLIDTFGRELGSPQELDTDSLALLKLLAYAHRPLTIHELSESRVIDLRTKEGAVDFQDRGHIEDMLHMLSRFNLITISGNNRDADPKLTIKHEDIDCSDTKFQEGIKVPFPTITLVHRSVREFLLSHQVCKDPIHSVDDGRQQEQYTLSHMCVVYLIQYSHTRVITKTSQDLEEFPLLQFAATSWYMHCQDIDDVEREVRFLLSKAFRDSLMIHDPDRPRKKPFDPHAGHEKTGPPLYYAALLGLNGVVRRLIETGVDVNAQGGVYQYALQAAIEKGHQETVRLLLEAGADVYAQDNLYGYTALHVAARNGHNDICQLLIDRGADVNIQDDVHGCTAMHMAAIRGHRKAVKLLLEAGTNVDVTLTVLGEKSRKVLADTMHDLGLLYYDQNELLNAEKMYLRTLGIYEQSRGKKHISTLMIVNNLGVLYKTAGKHDKALAMYMRAYQGYEGKADYKISKLKTANNLGTLYDEQGRFDLAQDMYVQAIQGYSETVGYMHSLTLDVITNLGGLLSKQGKTDIAERLFVQALRGYQALFGRKHIATLNTINNLGLIYKRQGRLEEAEQMLLRAFDGKEQLLGWSHPSTLNSVTNLAVIYSKQARQAEAEELLLGVLRGYKKAFGTEGAKTCIPALNATWALGNLYAQQSRSNHARDAYAGALYGYEIVCGRSSNQYLVLREQLDFLGC